ncbi:hypothetical protein HYU91_00240 [Candidatus Collierbacteria bacterium]|nr:hypothetical protein [Candidatus Collierbacteria bacterium]
MKKIVFSTVLGLVLLLTTAKVAGANEGVIQLAGKTDADGRCFAVSIYVDGNYKLLMTCRGLSMALDPVLNKYIVWANVGENKQRLGEIVNGKLSAVIGEKFDSLFVTLESDAYSNKPSINMVLNGKVEQIDFGKGVFNSSLAPTAMITQAVKLDDKGVAIVPTSAPTKNLTGAVVAIGKAILFGFIILLIIVGVMSFLARRKNL